MISELFFLKCFLNIFSSTYFMNSGFTIPKIKMYFEKNILKFFFSSKFPIPETPFIPKSSKKFKSNFRISRNIGRSE